MQDIEKRLCRIEEKLDGLSVSVNELVVAWPHLSRRLEAVEKHLYGDGSPGLLVKVHTLVYGAVVVASLLSVIVSHVVTRLIGV